MRTSYNPRYRPALTLKKALYTWLATTVAATAGIAAVDFPLSWLELRAQWPTLIVPLALAALRAYRNWRKHNPSSPPLPFRGGSS